MRTDGQFGQIVRRLPGLRLIVILDAAIDVDHFGKAEDRLETMQHERVAALALIVRPPCGAPAELVHLDGVAAILVRVVDARAARPDQDVAPDRNRQ